jgi:hypothetical protein
MAVIEVDKHVLTISSGSHAWNQVGNTLQSQLGAWYEYQDLIDWFKRQKATFIPLSDRIMQHYMLEFDTQEDLMEFVLTWL